MESTKLIRYFCMCIAALVLMAAGLAAMYRFDKANNTALAFVICADDCNNLGAGGNAKVCEWYSGNSWTCGVVGGWCPHWGEGQDQVCYSGQICSRQTGASVEIDTNATNGITSGYHRNELVCYTPPSGVTCSSSQIFDIASSACITRPAFGTAAFAGSSTTTTGNGTAGNGTALTGGVSHPAAGTCDCTGASVPDGSGGQKDCSSSRCTGSLQCLANASGSGFSCQTPATSHPAAGTCDCTGASVPDGSGGQKDCSSSRCTGSLQCLANASGSGFSCQTPATSHPAAGTCDCTGASVPDGSGGQKDCSSSRCTGSLQCLANASGSGFSCQTPATSHPAAGTCDCTGASVPDGSGGQKDCSSSRCTGSLQCLANASGSGFSCQTPATSSGCTDNSGNNVLVGAKQCKSDNSEVQVCKSTGWATDTACSSGLACDPGSLACVKSSSGSGTVTGTPCTYNTNPLYYLNNYQCTPNTPNSIDECQKQNDGTGILKTFPCGSLSITDPVGIADCKVYCGSSGTGVPAQTGANGNTVQTNSPVKPGDPDSLFVYAQKELPADCATAKKNGLTCAMDKTTNDITVCDGNGNPTKPVLSYGFDANGKKLTKSSDKEEQFNENYCDKCAKGADENYCKCTAGNNDIIDFRDFGLRFLHWFEACSAECEL